MVRSHLESASVEEESRAVRSVDVGVAIQAAAMRNELSMVNATKRDMAQAAFTSGHEIAVGAYRRVEGFAVADRTAPSEFEPSRVFANDPRGPIFAGHVIGNLHGAKVATQTELVVGLSQQFAR
jgi:hypothetical protein